MPRLIVRFLAFLFRPVANELRRQHEQEIDKRAVAIARNLRAAR